jgi:hypothetical protein
LGDLPRDRLFLEASKVSDLILTRLTSPLDKRSSSDQGLNDVRKIRSFPLAQGNSQSMDKGMDAK